VTCARKHIRPADVLFRCGSDEFVVVQFDTDKALAGTIAARIRQAVESESPVGVEARMKITVGVASMPDDGRSVEALVLAARQRTGAAGARPSDDPPERSGSIH